MHFSDPKLTIIQRHVADEERLITFLCRAFRNVSLQNSVEKVQTFNRMLTHIYRGRRPHKQSIHTQRLLKIFVKSWTTTMRCSRSQSQKNNKSVKYTIFRKCQDSKNKQVNVKVNWTAGPLSNRSSGILIVGNCSSQKNLLKKNKQTLPQLESLDICSPVREKN